MAQAEVKVVATLDNAPFKAGISGMSSQLAGMKGMIAGAFSVGAIISFGRNVLETMTRIKDLSIQAGISTDEFQGLSYVIRRAGADEDQLANALSRVDKAQQDALSGSKQMITAFNALNITQADLISKNPAELFLVMSRALADANMTGEPLMATMDIIGQKVAPKMKQAMQELAGQGLQAVIDKSKEAGEAFDAAFIQRADEAEDKIKGWGRKAKVGVVEFIGSIITARKETRELNDYIATLSKEEARSFRAKALFLDPDSGRKELLASIPERKAKSRAAMAEAGKALFQLTVGSGANGELTPEQKQRKLLADKADAIAAAAAKNLAQKNENAFTRADESERNKLDEMYRSQDELAVDYDKKRKDLMAGKGIEVPDRARVDSLQAIGGIIGGVAGRGDQAARIAERQAKSTEAIETLMRETNGKLDDLNRKMDGIISE